MYELKTQKNDAGVEEFLASVDPKRIEDSRTLLAMMREITGEEPALWGASIVGFGKYHYKYKTGHEGDWFLTGFSPRKQSFSVHIMTGFDHYPELMAQLGKFKTGKSCLYINKLADVDLKVLRKLIKASVGRMRKGHGCGCG